MADSMIKRLEEEILVMSGAMSTMMAKVGADLGGCIGQWIVEHPEAYRDLVRDYFRWDAISFPVAPST
jgi:methionine synthase I (cobalamin-dependent)